MKSGRQFKKKKENDFRKKKRRSELGRLKIN